MYELCGGPYSSHVEGAAGSEACLSPPKVACNSIGRRFNKARKRCNSNAVNSRFEIVTGELHAKLVASSAIRRLKRWGPGGLAERTPHATSEEGADRAAAGPGCGHGGITGPRRIKVARNSPRSFFEHCSKRCNSNDAKSRFGAAAGELRATLSGNHPRCPHKTRPGHDTSEGA